MNIHIQKEKFEKLINAPRIGIFNIGSPLYELNDEGSDIDYLVIYYPFKNQIYNPFLNHHQFQYKDLENNIDYNFVDVGNFIKNLISGDSTVNFEVLFSGQLQETSLNWLEEYKNDFYTYTIARSYLGMAKRDAEQFWRRKTERDKRSGILHIARGLRFAEGIMNQNFNLVISELKNLKENFDPKYDNKSFSIKMLEYIKNTRNDLNLKLQNGSISRYLNPKVQELIIGELASVPLYFNNRDVIDLSDIYEANENPELKYE